MTKRRFLTGIKPSGIPHLGNYLGAIRPSILASREEGVESFYFLADFHAQITSLGDPNRIHRATLEIAATWLAAGLDPERVTFYRQSDIPEIPELTWFLTCVTGKGVLNRAHAYKAAVDKNIANEEDPDAGVSAGLFMYPVLMAADILMFKSHYIPVGRDQVQHVEMARDIAERFNYYYGNGRELMVLPQAQIDDGVATLPGLDGRKMSKSYGNVLPLFAPPAEMQRLINQFVTDMKAPGEAKDPESSSLFEIYAAFANEEEKQAMRQAYADGIAWGEVKRLLFERVEREIAPMRAYYEELMANPSKVEDILVAGGQRARKISKPYLAELRDAVGFRSLRLPTIPITEKESGNVPVEAAVVFKQY
ncbi:MAG: tryptophan--tRNA ligase, partial [Saezia sp.]